MQQLSDKIWKKCSQDLDKTENRCRQSQEMRPRCSDETKKIPP